MPPRRVPDRGVPKGLAHGENWGEEVRGDDHAAGLWPGIHYLQA